MESKKKKEVIKKEDGSMYDEGGQYWTENGLRRYRNYQTEYIKISYRTFMFRVRKDKEGPLIKFCESQKSLAALLVKLLKGEMMRQGVIPNEDFAPENDPILKCEITLYLLDGKERILEYIMPKMDEMPAKLEGIKYTLLGAVGRSMMFELSYPSDYSLQGAATEIATNVEKFIQNKCKSILVQFGINPKDDILEKKYTIDM